ncbi:MAG TPA: 6-carboxytetrahydropterin synthase [Dehalococcoidia bacterium]|nr:6-carboxytetrahydropterin synthase [Dehalococcoidia bacterium]
MSAGERYQVRVENIGFVAGHFATFGGSCEPLHGHNYEVAAEVEGTLSEDSWVVNFITLKNLLRDASSKLDHRFMLQRDSRILEIDETETAWKVKTPAGTGYVLPRTDVVALPIDNTTAERLAKWFCDGMWSKLAARSANMDSLTVEVWEGPGQRASYRRDRKRLA